MSESPGGSRERLLVLGASFSAGLGCYDRPAFGPQLAAKLGAELLDLSRPSRLTSGIVAEDLSEVERFRPTVALLELGGAEAMVFPGAGIERLLEKYAPPSWHGVAGLAPRVAFSRSRLRRIRQRVEEPLRALVKWLLIFVTNAGPRVPLDQYRPYGRQVIETLTSLGCTVFLIGYPPQRAMKFPRSPRYFAEVNDIHRGWAREMDRVHFVPSSSWLGPGLLMSDGMHLTGDGHDRLAAVLQHEVSGAR